MVVLFFFSSRRRHTRLVRDWSSDVCSSDLKKRRSAAEQGNVSSIYIFYFTFQLFIFLQLFLQLFKNLQLNCRVFQNLNCRILQLKCRKKKVWFESTSSYPSVFHTRVVYLGICTRFLDMDDNKKNSTINHQAVLSGAPLSILGPQPF